MILNCPRSSTIRSSRLLLCACLASLITGCAYTNTETKVNFAPGLSEPLRQSKATLQVEEGKDTRAVNDPRVIIHKANNYGRTTGAYVAPIPVSELFRKGLVAALRTNAFQVVSNAATYSLNFELQEFDYDTLGGVWTVTTKPKCAVRFELTEKSTGRSVWRDTLVGRSEHITNWRNNVWFVSETFTNSAGDTVRQLITNKEFRRYFE